MAACNPLDIGCNISNGIGDLAGSAFQQAADATFQGWGEIQQSFMTSWLNAQPLQDLTAGTVPWMQALLSQFAFLFAVSGVLITALYTVLALRGDRVQQLGLRLVRTLVVTAAGTGVFAGLVTAMDTLAMWILNQAGVSATGQMDLAAVASVSPGISLIGAIVGIFGVIIQWGIMLIRGAILPLLLALWPVSAAASTFRSGEKSFQNITGWLIAFLLYKPAAAIVYAFAFQQQTGGAGIGGIINGLILTVIAVLALPALFRLIVPAAGALGNAVGGAIALAGTAAVISTGVAVGAAVVTGGGSAAAGGLGAGGLGAGGLGGGGAMKGPSAGGAPAGAAATPAPAAATPAGGSAGGGAGPTGATGGRGASGNGRDGSPGRFGTNGQSGMNGGNGPAGASGASGGGRGGGGARELGRQVSQRMPGGSTRGLEESFGE